MRVLVTDASTKHAIALQRGLRSAFADLCLIGHDRDAGWLARAHGLLDRHVRKTPLGQALANEAFDLVIPVGGRSVREVASACPGRAVLPPCASLDACYDKSETLRIAGDAGIPYPETCVLRTPADAEGCRSALPCVLKPQYETDLKAVRYADSVASRTAAARELFHALGADAEGGVLVQDHVRGGGHGLFALYDSGRPLRVFMHQRLREFPVSGGASCAARAFYNEDLMALGLRLLDALRWHGVAMVEFKREASSGRFLLMEVNAKFWGSYELALRAGMNFGADLVRLFRGERLEFSDSFDRECRFYWPLDGDLQHLGQTHQLKHVSDYWSAGAHTNVFQSLRADAWKVMRLVRDAIAD